MTLEALANIGELIAGLGVVASLVFLAIQIRQNTKSVDSAAYQETTKIFQNIQMLPVTDAEVAEILMKASNDYTSLSDVEKYRVGSYVFSVFAAFQSVFKGYENGTVDKELWIGSRNAIKTMLPEEYVTIWWREQAPPMSDGFTKEINSIYIEIGRT